MRTAAIIVALILIVLAIPLVRRIDSAIADRRRGAAILDGARFVGAIAAAAGLLAFVWRGR